MSHPIYRFADCTMDLARRELRRGEEIQHLEPQVFALLTMLVEASGRAVTKDEIIATIWDGRAISDDALSSRIRAARRAIGDDGREQRLIRTLHRVGYRFEATVTLHVDTPGRTQSITPRDNDGRQKDDETPAATGEPEAGFFKDRKNRSIGYSTLGNGPLVIMPAFWVSAADIWHDNPDIVSFYTALSLSLRIVRYDRPGSGLSRGAALNETLRDEVDLLEDMVDHLGEARYGLFATSAGGPTAVIHAVEHASRVKRICFYGSYLDGALTAPPEVRDLLVDTVRTHWGLGSRTMADIFVPNASPEIRKRFAQYQRSAAEPEVAAAMLRLSYDLNASEQAGRISVPTLVLHRDGDRAVPPELGRQIARTIPHARFKQLQGDAHPPWIGGEDIARYANAFLREDPSGTA